MNPWPSTLLQVGYVHILPFSAPKKSTSDFLSSCKWLKKRSLRVFAQLVSQAGDKSFRIKNLRRTIGPR